MDAASIVSGNTMDVKELTFKKQDQIFTEHRCKVTRLFYRPSLANQSSEINSSLVESKFNILGTQCHLKKKSSANCYNCKIWFKNDKDGDHQN